jgi:hypothetical protein
VAFLDYLGQANAGAHLAGFGDAALAGISVPPADPLSVRADLRVSSVRPEQPADAIWGSVGGFVTVTAFGLAVLALWSRRGRSLKLYLALWHSWRH